MALFPPLIAGLYRHGAGACGRVDVCGCGFVVYVDKERESERDRYIDIDIMFHYDTPSVPL